MTQSLFSTMSSRVFPPSSSSAFVSFSHLFFCLCRCSTDDKYLLLYFILKMRLIKGKCIIFVNDVDRCYRLKLFLEQFGIKSCVLNAELPQNSRYHIVQEFNRGVYDYIIATDEGEVAEEPEEDGADEEVDEEGGSSRHFLCSFFVFFVLVFYSFIHSSSSFFQQGATQEETKEGEEEQQWS